MGLSVLKVFLACCFVSFASSCSCVDNSQMTLEDIYCEATYIVQIRIDVKERVIVDPSESFLDEWRYSISTLDKYKTCGEYDAVVNKSSLYTALESATCGVNYLDVGSTYVIAGFVSQGQLRIHSCSLLLKPVGAVTVDELTYLQEEYAKGCHYCNGQARGVYPAWVLVVFLMSMAIYQQTSQLMP